MCGLIGGAIEPETVESALASIRHRGPDDSGIGTRGQFTLGHTRLAIQDLDHAPRQPGAEGGITATFNGEIWQPERLRATLAPRNWASSGDTEAVIAALSGPGEHALKGHSGMWALAWSDGATLKLSRDPYGEVPLHYGRDRNGRILWGSEIAPLLKLGAYGPSIRWVPPGHTVTLSQNQVISIEQWDDPHQFTPTETPDLAALLRQGVIDRMRADVPVAVLLSGGLDSSAILALLVEAGYHPQCYTAVHDRRSPDTRWARTIAAHLGVELIEVPVPAPTRAKLSEAVAVAEMPHKAQIEITVACLELARAIHSDGFKVVLSGEGSDELFASYGMAYHGIAAKGWDRYRFEGFTGQHRKNFARTNKVFMRAGVEARLPFLHPPLVRAALRMSPEQVRHAAGRAHPKAALAAAIAPMLPPHAVWRTKEAFQSAAKLDRAAAGSVADPARYYRAEFARLFPGVKP